MTTTAGSIQITGYTAASDCMCCGRTLKHTVVTDAGVFGGQCFAKKITAPRQHRGKPYRLDAASVINTAKVVQYAPAHLWSQYGVNEASRTFEAAGVA